jgi:Coenzyme PQQ synthesis protein D (PqqD)
MPSIESADEVSEKTRTFIPRQWDAEEPRYTLTNTGNGTLDLLGGCGINVHLQCPANLTIDDEPVGMNFSRCRFTALHRRSYAVAPLPTAELGNDENSVSRWHAGRDSKMDTSPVPDLSITDAVRVPEDVIFRELNGEAVVLNLDSGTYFGLNSVGMRIWQLCQEHGSLREVWEAMQREFDAPGEALQSDLLAFVNELSSKRLLTRQ